MRKIKHKYLNNINFTYRILLIAITLLFLNKCNNKDSKNMNQNEFRKKIARFIKKDIKYDQEKGLIYSKAHNNKKELYERFNKSGGHCQGLAGLWLLDKRITDENIHNSKILEYEIIKNKLINWDGTNTYSDQNKKDIYEYLNFLNNVQRTDKGQKEIYQIIHDPILGIPTMEIHKSGIFSKKQIIEVLNKHLKPGKMIALGLSKHGKHNHATAIYKNKANEIFYFDSNFDENECQVNNVEEAVEEYYKSSSYFTELDEYNKSIDQDLREFEIVISDFAKIPKGINNHTIQKIDNLINTFGDDKRKSRYNEFYNMQKKDAIDFINKNSDLYTGFCNHLDKTCDNLDETLKAQIKFLKLNENNICDFLNNNFIKNKKIKK